MKNMKTGIFITVTALIVVILILAGFGVDAIINKYQPKEEMIGVDVTVKKDSIISVLEIQLDSSTKELMVYKNNVSILEDKLSYKQREVNYLQKQKTNIGNMIKSDEDLHLFFKDQFREYNNYFN